MTTESSTLQSTWQGAKPLPTLLITALCLFMWLMPTPTGLSTQAWHLFTIFLGTVISLVARPMPVGSVAVIVIVVSIMTGTLTAKQVYSGFSSQIVWLIFAAICVARGFIKTGLGRRVAYYFIRTLGKSTLGMSYGVIITEFFLAPFIPSNTARGSGVMLPIVSSLIDLFDSHPKQGTERRIGSFLLVLLYHTNVITSAMFLTAMAGNPLLVSFAAQAGFEITWLSWAMSCIVPGIACLILLPFLLMLIYPPELKETPEAPSMAAKKLQEMGNMAFQEIIMLITFGVLLSLWVAGPYIGVDATTTALLGLGILLVTGVLTWDDILNEKTAWNTFFWMAVLLVLSSNLNELGMIDWFSSKVQGPVSNMNWFAAAIILAVVYYYAHYMFASMTAHISAMFAAIIAVGVSAGAPLELMCTLLMPLSSLCAGITHYGTGNAPVIFAKGYVKITDWWRIGFIVSLMHMLIWLTLGIGWWKVIGIW